MNSLIKFMSLPEWRKTVLRRDVSLAVLALAAGFAQPAFAYLDPSTGGMIISAILGLFATIGLAMKTYWYKLKNFFAGKKPAPETATAADPESDKRQE
jgi:hypothetical protein